MSVCKRCSRTFHSCVSCTLDGWEEEFCTEDCLNEYLDLYFKDLQSFLRELSIEQRATLYRWALENGGDLEGTHEADVLSFRDLILKAISKVNTHG